MLECNKLNLFFNESCVRKDVIPKYINIQIRNNTRTAILVKAKAEKLWLKNEIKMLYTKINRLTMEVYSLQLRIAAEFHYLNTSRY